MVLCNRTGSEIGVQIGWAGMSVLLLVGEEIVGLEMRGLVSLIEDCLSGHGDRLVGHRVVVLIVWVQGLHKVLVSVSHAFSAPCRATWWITLIKVRL